jgi:carbamoyltransferase
VRASAILVQDGRIIAGLEEAKLSGQRAGDRECFPEAAVAMCCAHAGIPREAVDQVIYYGNPYRRFRSSVAANLTRNAGRPVHAAYAALCEGNILRRHLHSRRERNIPWQYADHLRSHAAWSLFTSPHERAAILVLAGYGDPRTVAAGVGEGSAIRWLYQGIFPDSLGWLYSQVTQAIGLRPLVDESRVQWLSTTGDVEHGDLFSRLLQVDSKYAVRIHRDFLSGGFRPLGLDAAFRSGAAQVAAKNVAASLQEQLEEVCLRLAAQLRADTRMDALCLAGGVAENALLVTRLQQSGIFRHLHVPPAPGNTGAAGGAALDFWYRHSGRAERHAPGCFAFGPAYSDQEIKAEIDACKAPSRFVNSEAEIIKITTDLLAQGRLVGWFQGRTELGRRALGFRSVLADASGEFVQDNINRYLKRREAHHPFAVSVTRESADDYFTALGSANDVLAAAARLKPEAPEFLHRLKFRGDWVRVHTVDRLTNPRLWTLLTQFAAHSGHAVLINTSLNLPGEPLASHPRDALRTFFASALDALAIGRFVLQK